VTALAFVVKYWREITLGLCVLFVLAVLAIGGFYIHHVISDRTRLQAENSTLQQQVKDAEATAKLNNRIADAISQIRIRSQINVSRIESEPKPVFEDDEDPATPPRPLPFIPGGVLQAVYSSGSAGRAAPGPAPGPPLAAGE
jgi:hypothetical protein